MYNHGPELPELTLAKQEFYLGQELSSKLGQKITIQFLAYKPLLFTTYNKLTEESIPKKLRFDFDF